MTTTNALSRQPTKLDLAAPTQFKFNIIKLPKVEYFCTAANIPGVNLSEIRQMTPLADIPVPGEKITFGDLEVTFMVDENLENFREIHGWLMGLGFPKSRTQFKDIVNAGADRFPTSTGSVSTEPGKVKYGAAGQGGIFSDATLTILTSKNNAQLEVRFSDLFPTSLSGLDYGQQTGDINYLSATVTFKYSLYRFASVGSSTTSVTTS